MSFWLEKFLYKKSALINVLTPAFRTTLIEKKKINPDKIIFIPNAADFSLSEELTNSFDVAAFRKENNFGENLVITYVGAHGVANHLIQVLETAEMLKNEKVLFLLIGDGMQKKYLKTQAQEKSLTNIRFIDPVVKKEVFKYILASDLGASVLKKVDTFKTVYSNKTFDYMSCKKPILMAIDGVSRELLELADAGKYVEPENPSDFADKIKFYISSPEELIRQGNSGYAYAKKYFDRTHLAEEYLTYLEKVKKK